MVDARLADVYPGRYIGIAETVVPPFREEDTRVRDNFGGFGGEVVNYAPSY